MIDSDKIFMNEEGEWMEEISCQNECDSENFYLGLLLVNEDRSIELHLKCNICHEVSGFFIEDFNFIQDFLHKIKGPKETKNVLKDALKKMKLN